MSGPSQRFEEKFEEEIADVNVGPVTLEGGLAVPDDPQGVVLFAHGSGSSRHSPRNKFVAQTLYEGGVATLLIDLLTSDEESVDRVTREHRFNIQMLAERLVGAIDWLAENESTKGLDIGLFGSSTGGGAALVAAARRPEATGAVVSRGGRPDLAKKALERVQSPTLLIVGGHDTAVIGMNEEAMGHMKKAEVKLEIVQGASHLFQEPGKLEEVADLARDFFQEHLE